MPAVSSNSSYDLDKHSVETSAAMQADHLSLDVKELQPFIATIAPSGEQARKAQGMLLDLERGDG